MTTKVIKMSIIALLICSSFQILNCSQDHNRISDDVAQLVSDLKHGDLAKRWEAMQRIKELGPKAKSAIPALIDALGDEHPQLSSEASSALIAIGEYSIPGLILALENHTNPQIRMKAAEILGAFKKRVTQILPSLIAALEDDELENIPYVISKIGETAIELLVEAAESPSWMIRAGVMESLWINGWESEVPSEIFYKNLDDESIFVRIEAAAGVSYLYGDYSSARPHFIEGLENENPDIRLKVAKYIAVVDAGFIGAIPFLVAALEDDNKEIRNAASIAIGEIGIEAIPLLRASLESPNPKTRYATINSIRLMGEDATDTIPILHKYLADGDKEVRFITAAALYELGYEDESLVVVLVEMLDDYERKPFLALKLLGNLGSKAVGALPALNDVADNDENEVVRKIALAAINKIEAASKDE